MNEQSSFNFGKNGKGDSEDLNESRAKAAVGTNGEGQGVAMAEEWRPVVGHEGYDVSNMGNIRSWHVVGAARRWGRFLESPRPIKLHIGNVGYPVFIASKKPMCVHRAVAMAFLGPVPEGMQVGHLDGSKDNNHFQNLKYVTPKENASHRPIHGTELFGSKNPSSVLTESKAAAIKSEPYWRGVVQMLAKKYGVSKSTVKYIRSGERWNVALNLATK